MSSFALVSGRQELCAWLATAHNYKGRARGLLAFTHADKLALAFSFRQLPVTPIYSHGVGSGLSLASS